MAQIRKYIIAVSITSCWFPSINSFVSGSPKKINIRLAKTGKIKVFDVFSMAKSRSELVASFLAILEMAKDEKIILSGEHENLSIELNLEEKEADENG